MRIGIVSTAVPLARGGARLIVDWLEDKLREYGHAVEVVYIPCTEELPEILPQMAAFRMIRLDHYFDRIITTRPPAHVVQHPCKVVWLLHHVRMFYDLWGTTYSPVPDNEAGRALRTAIMAADRTALGEAHRLFANSHVVANRIRRFNDLESEVLYPPILRAEVFRSGDYGDEIVSICRMERHKRQHLMVQAMASTKTDVRLRLCGPTLDPGYVEALRESARQHGVADRVKIESRWISEEEKIAILESALASAYVPFDEDSYGYPTLEAAHARRSTVTASDSGGVSEFVTSGITGLIVDPDPVALADAFDRLHANRTLAQKLGTAASERVTTLGIDWTTVIGKLLS